MVLRRKRDPDAPVFFTSPGPMPWVAAALCIYLAGPWVDRDSIVYEIAGGLMLIGIVLWVITFLVNKATNKGPGRPVGTRNIGKDEGMPPPPPGH
jgi:hypothetical protein